MKAWGLARFMVRAWTAIERTMAGPTVGSERQLVGARLEGNRAERSSPQIARRAF